MIISARHKFIFVAVPKTGTHAVRQALREHMGPQDLEQVGLFVKRQFPIPELAKLQHGHLTLEQVKPYFKPEEWSSLFKFAFVRNPFDRFISYCAFMTRERGEFEQNPQRVMRHYVANPPWQHVLFQPQHEFVTDQAGAKLSDAIGRVETMQQSYDEIAERIGIPTTTLRRVNPSKRLDYRQYYDQDLIDGVARLYARDLEYFGYEF